MPRDHSRGRLRSGDLCVDAVRRVVKWGDEVVHPTPKGYEQLRVLVQQAGRVVTQRHLLQAVWGPAQVEDATYLRVFIGQLRRKVEPDPERPSLILTEPGVGYRLREDGDWARRDRFLSLAVGPDILAAALPSWTEFDPPPRLPRGDTARSALRGAHRSGPANVC